MKYGQRTYGPMPLVIPSKQSLKRTIKGAHLQARHAFEEEKRILARIIETELKTLYKELYG